MPTYGIGNLNFARNFILSWYHSDA